jgi:hypothetical protein
MGISPLLNLANGKATRKAKFNDTLDLNVVATVYGWWQACQVSFPHDPFTLNGANTNLLIPNIDNDSISASVAHCG